MASARNTARQPDRNWIKYLCANIKLFNVLFTVFLWALPGIPIILNYSPPWCSRWGIEPIVGVVGFVCFLWSYMGKKGRRTRLLQYSLQWLGPTAIIFIGGYLQMFEYSTKLPPPDFEGTRIQIGFGMHYLTRDAKETIKTSQNEKHPVYIDTPEKLMDAYGIWGGNQKPSIIWQPWSIWLAGAINFVLFFCLFSAWSFGMGILMRYLFNPRQ